MEMDEPIIHTSFFVFFDIWAASLMAAPKQNTSKRPGARCNSQDGRIQKWNNKILVKIMVTYNPSLWNKPTKALKKRS